MTIETLNQSPETAETPTPDSTTPVPDSENNVRNVPIVPKKTITYRDEKTKQDISREVTNFEDATYNKAYLEQIELCKGRDISLETLKKKDDNNEEEEIDCMIIDGIILQTYSDCVHTYETVAKWKNNTKFSMLPMNKQLYRKVKDDEKDATVIEEYIKNIYSKLYTNICGDSIAPNKLEEAVLKCKKEETKGGVTTLGALVKYYDKEIRNNVEKNITEPHLDTALESYRLALKKFGNCIIYNNVTSKAVDNVSDAVAMTYDSKNGKFKKGDKRHLKGCYIDYKDVGSKEWSEKRIAYDLEENKFGSGTIIRMPIFTPTPNKHGINILNHGVIGVIMRGEELYSREDNTIDLDGFMFGRDPSTKKELKVKFD